MDELTGKTTWTEAYAIVRRDFYPGSDMNPDSAEPPMICGGEYSYTVKEVVLDAVAAEREVARLNAESESETTRYFWEYTHLFLDGGSNGES